MTSLSTAKLLGWVAWNVFLAVIPVVVAWPLARQLRQAGGRRPGAWLGLLLLAALWLGFLPNAPYLLTEWRHWFNVLERKQLWVRWHDEGELAAFWELAQLTLFFAAFSLAGVITYWAALRPVLATIAGKHWRWLLLLVLSWLNGLGVHLGLELRFNTWDLLHTPGSIVDEALRALRVPGFHGFILGFTLLLWLLYESTETFCHGLRARWAGRSTAARR